MQLPNMLIRQMTPADGDLMVEFYAALSAKSLFFFTPHDPGPDKLRELVAGIAHEVNLRVLPRFSR